MGIDTSFYANIRQPEAPDLMGAMQKGMSLSQLALQNRQMQQQAGDQDAVRTAFSKNVGPDGQVNRQGVLSDLAKTAPMKSLEMQGHFAQMDSAQAEAKAKTQSAQVDAAQKTLSFTVPALHYLAGLPEDQRAAQYPAVMSKLASAGVNTQNMPPQYDPGHFRQVYAMTDAIGTKMKDFLENAKTQSEIGQAPAKMNAELYGSRSPNAELTSQYTKEPSTAIARSSQVAMKQMMDNYNHPSPQGDASLVLNAFKIKFPNAPDVNSLKELGESQATIDQWKNLFHKSAEGGFDQATRDNLMRDGISTFRANAESLKDTQGKYSERAKAQNVGDTSFMLEPAVEKTYGQSMKLQDKIGPYTPPTERGGVLAGIGKAISGAISGTGEKTAAAQEKPKTNFRETGSKVSADEVAQYATRHKMKLSDAEKFLKGQGYAID